MHSLSWEVLQRSERNVEMNHKFVFLSLLTMSGVGLVASAVKAQSQPNSIVWNSRDTSVNPLYESYADGVPFNDLDGYARSRFGSTASAYMERDHAYGWKIKYRTSTGWRVVGIDMLDAAQYHGRKKFGNRLKNWGCYFKNWSGTSWRGGYIVRNF